MPFLGYVAVSTLSDPDDFPACMGMTLLIVTSSPGGSFSNWFCSMFNADLALSVTMTALSTFLSTFLLPANLILYTLAAYGSGKAKDMTEANPDQSIQDLERSVLENLDWIDLFVTLVVVIFAIIMGLIASIKFPTERFHRWANAFGTFSGLALVTFTFLLGTFGGNPVDNSKEDKSKIWNQTWLFYVGVALPCMGGLFLANMLSYFARLSHPERVTISIECSYQNVGIATSAAVSMYNDPQERAKAICVPLFYGFVEAVLLGIYCLISWKLGWTKAPRNENLWVMLSTTYEVKHDSEEIESSSSNDDEASLKSCDMSNFRDDVTTVTEDTGVTSSTNSIRSDIKTPGRFKISRNSPLQQSQAGLPDPPLLRGTTIDLLHEAIDEEIEDKLIETSS